MKIHGLLFMLITSLLVMTGCTTNSFYQTTVNHNLVKENWMSNVNLSSSSWTRNADPWFLTGEPNRVEQYSSNASQNAAISTMSVNVGGFDSIVVNGSFQVQIVGGQDHDSIFVFGPNDAVRQVSIKTFNHALHINQVDAKANVKRVIVRIGVRNLRNITNLGKGSIYGRGVTSDCLAITACDCGSVILSGQMNLNKVTQLGTGTITVIGAYTPNLDINVKGNGNVNVCGRVGVRRITHMGDGCVSIIGTDTDSLSILASGNGTTSVAGYANLKKLTACDASRVYVYWVNSANLYITQSGSSRVGLAGSVNNMNLDMIDSSRFGGQYLHGGSIYVRTRNWAHANVAPDKKIFAAALDKSSIYIFGCPNIVSRYTSNSGVILPVWNDSKVLPMLNLGDGCLTQPRQPTLMPQRIYKQ
jgi:hypothetical protein